MTFEQMMVGSVACINCNAIHDDYLTHCVFCSSPLHDSPCDEWPVFVWNGELCQLGQVTMWDAPTCGDKDIVSWKWATGWQCYVVNIAVPLGQPMPVDEIEGPLRDWMLI